MIKQALIRARSWLFAPATRPDRFAKASMAGAGVATLGLEEAVAPMPLWRRSPAEPTASSPRPGSKPEPPTDFSIAR